MVAIVVFTPTIIYIIALHNTYLGILLCILLAPVVAGLEQLLLHKGADE